MIRLDYFAEMLIKFKQKANSKEREYKKEENKKKRTKKEMEDEGEEILGLSFG